MSKALVCAAIFCSTIFVGCLAKTTDDGSGSAALSGTDSEKPKDDPGKTDPGKDPGKPGDPGCGKDVPPSPKPICDGDVVYSDDKSCVDLAILEKLGIMRCAERGGALTSIVPDGGCDKGQGTIAKITCCAPLPAATSPEPCEGFAITAGDACIDPGTLKLKADADCSSRGAVLTELWPDSACADGGSHNAKYVCCGGKTAPPSKEPPPPDKK
ncbi:MAG: hypothetical protein ACXVEE_20930 [Polyangiales bacterium]